MKEARFGRVFVSLLVLVVLLAGVGPAGARSESTPTTQSDPPHTYSLVPQAGGRRDQAKEAGPDLAWQIETVDSAANVGWWSSLALDNAGRPHIAYLDADSWDLKYARYDGTAWLIEVVDSAGNVGPYMSLMLDTAGRPHISYEDESNRDIKYARYDGTTWHVEVVDSAGELWDTDMALDSADRPHICYYDHTNGDLKYAHYNGTAWEIEVVDGAGYVGQYNSLVLDTAERPHISYYDTTNTDLKYAHYDGTAWQIETVDATGDVGMDTSLVLDAAGRPAIAYSDDGNADLKYARYDGTAWQIETVDSAGNVGWYSSLVLDPAGRPNIAYCYYPDGWPCDDLKYALFDGTAWQIEVVDSANDVGVSESMAMTPLGAPHISYYDATNGDLKYAWSEAPAGLFPSKQAPAAVEPGAAMTYTIAIWSSGAPQYQSVLSDTLPGLLAYIPGTAWASSGVVTGTAGAIAWSGLVSNTQSVTITFQVTVSAAAGDGTVIVNQATISGSGVPAPIIIAATTIVDVYPPTGSLSIDGGADYAATSAVTLTPSAQDSASGVTGMQFHDEGQPWGSWEGYAVSKDWMLPAGDGPKAVYVRYQDAVGHVSTEYSDTIILDTAAPSGSLTINDGAQYAPIPTVTLATPAGDATSGVEAMQFQNEDGAWSAWESYAISTTWLLSPGDGTKTVSARYRDAAGNISVAYTDDIILETTIPFVQMDTLLPWHNTLTVTLGWSGWGGGAIAGYDVQAREGDGVWTPWLTATLQTSAIFTGVNGHAYAFRARAVNEAGNWGPWSAVVGTRIDAQRVLEYLHVNDAALETVYTQVLLLLRGNGAVRMRLSNDGMTYTLWEAFAETKEWTLPAGNGEKPVYVQLTNVLSETHSYSDIIALNTTVPGVVGVSINSGAGQTDQVTATLTLKAPAYASEMLIANDGLFIGSEWEPYRSQRQWILLYDPYNTNAMVYVLYRLADGTITGLYVDNITLLVQQQPPELDFTPPSGSMVINLDAPETTTRTVQLDVIAADSPGGVGVCWMAFREWKFDPVLMQWVIVGESGWVEYGPNHAWTLAPGNGVKYAGAWFADCNNNVSHPVVLDSINLVEDGAPAGQGEIEHFRRTFTAGQMVTITLSTTVGDVDLYVWQPGSTGVPDYWSNRPGLEQDQVVFTAMEGEYLIEVHGYLNSQYSIVIDEGGSGRMGSRRPTLGVHGYEATTAKPLPQHPLVTSVPGEVITFNVYLPLVVRQ